MITIPDPPADGEVSAAYGRRLVRLRGKRSQAEVAELVGASQPMVAKAERGEASEELLEKLHRLYGDRGLSAAAPRHPLRVREWVERRNAVLRAVGSRDAAVSERRR